MILLLAIFSFAPPTIADRAESKSLNAKGYGLYKEGQFDEALKMFRLSVKVDPTYGQAHYNIACTLGVIRMKEGPCGLHEIYKDDILKHLLLTLKYMPSKRSKMLTDPDLRPVHDTFGWQVILKRSTTNTADVIEILSAISWYGPSPGAYGPMSGFDFQKNGSVKYWFLDINADPVARTYVKGAYKVNENKITITFESKTGNPRTIQGTLSSGGILEFKGKEFPLEKYTDSPDECSA